MNKESNNYSFPKEPVQIELMSCDWQSLKDILKSTIEWSEKPLYEYEYQAIQRLLGKIAEQPLIKEDSK
jgi:hypothetical protein